MIKNYFTYYSQKYASKWLVLAIDLSMVLIAFFVAYFIRFNFTLDFDIDQFLVQLPLLFVVAGLSFLIVGSYKSVIRHTGLTDVMNLFKAVALMTFMTGFLVVFNRLTELMPEFTIPLSIIIIHSLLSFLALSASRLIFKMMYRYIQCRFITSKRILIFGSGDSAIVTYNALVNNIKAKFEILGFIDENNYTSGKSINGW